MEEIALSLFSDKICFAVFMMFYLNDNAKVLIIFDINKKNNIFIKKLGIVNYDTYVCLNI